jgi:hypothetical protein
VANGGNGWRSGTDPLLRWLRSGTLVAFVFVFVFVALDRDRDPGAVMTILALAGGAALILLGYQAVVKLPVIGRDDDEEKE